MQEMENKPLIINIGKIAADFFFFVVVFCSQLEILPREGQSERGAKEVVGGGLGVCTHA